MEKEEGKGQVEKMERRVRVDVLRELQQPVIIVVGSFFSFFDWFLPIFYFFFCLLSTYLNNSIAGGNLGAADWALG
jgi:hypothetical protein